MPGESSGGRSLVGYSLWGLKESDSTERLHFLSFLSTVIYNGKESEKESIYVQASLVAQMVKHLPAMQETQVQSLGWEDPLGKEMAAHSSTLAWKIPWMEKPGGLQSVGSQRVRHD